MDRRLLLFTPSKDFSQRGSRQQNPGLLKEWDDREGGVCHCGTRKAPPTNRSLTGWVPPRKHPQSFHLPLCLRLSTLLSAHLVKQGSDGSVTTQGHPHIRLHLSQLHFHWPLSVVWPPSLRKRKKSLEDQPQPRQVRPGGLSLVQRNGVSLSEAIAPGP